MRLSWNEVRASLSFGAQALTFGAAVSLACSGGDDFTKGGGGTAGRGGMAGNDGSAGNGGSAGSGGGSGAGGMAGRGGSGGSAGSSGSAGSGGTSGSSGADGGGTAGTGGSAGSSGGMTGSAGTAGAAGTAGSAGTAGTGGATSCRWGTAGACPTGQYCNALGCEDGTCMPLPAEGPTKSMVCGCDGLTYWNPSVAGHRGMSVRSMGECTPARTCGGIGTIECPGNGASCNMKILDSTLCVITDPAGTCVVLPSVCPSGPAIGPRTRACSATACKSECELIRAEQPWYEDNTCPT